MSDATADPPAYTPEVRVPATSTRRTIEDTRALILGNANVMKKYKDWGPIELIVGKTRSPAKVIDIANSTRSFTSQKSNVTLVINDSPAAGSSSRGASERRISNSDAFRVAGKHYAVLVYRTAHRGELAILMKGEPQDTVEEALEWLLDKTEMEITDMLAKQWPEFGS